jgi:CheY-like chemotaxis protein
MSWANKGRVRNNSEARRNLRGLNNTDIASEEKIVYQLGGTANFAGIVAGVFKRTCLRSKKKPTALVVDDNPTQRYVLSRLVEQAGYEFTEAQHAEEALENLKQDLPDVVVCDIKLARMDGFELCRRVKKDKRTAGVEVILVTSMYYSSAREKEDTEKGRKKAKECGALELLPRGDAMHELLPMLVKLGKK